MKMELYSNGFRAFWDETITVGSLIISPHKGYHVVTAIDYPNNQVSESFGVYLVDGEQAPIFTYVQVLTEDGEPVKNKKPKQSSASRCKLVTFDFAEASYRIEKLKLESKFLNLKRYIV